MAYVGCGVQDGGGGNLGWVTRLLLEVLRSDRCTHEGKKNLNLACLQKHFVGSTLQCAARLEKRCLSLIWPGQVRSSETLNFGV